MRKIIIWAILSLMTLSSCSSKVVTDTGKLDLRIADLSDYITVTTKAEAGIDYTNTANYDVVIDGPTPYTGKYSHFTGNVIELGSGHYTITVTSPGTEPAAFEQPIYQAKDEFEIVAGQVTPLDLNCTPLNCKVTIELTDNFKKELSSYTVTVSNGSGSLTWAKNAETDDFAQEKAGYFIPRGLAVKVDGYRSIDGTEASTIYYIKDPKPAEHHVLKLDAKVTGKIEGVEIEISTEFNEVEQDVHVPGIDEENQYVDGPDFGDDDTTEDDQTSELPTIEWVDADVNDEVDDSNPTFSPVNITSSTKIKMVIKAPLGIKEFRVEVSENFKGAIKVVTKVERPDDGIDYIDLINHGDTWEKFNLPVGESVLNQTELVFELTPFISTLCSAAAGMEVQFTLYCLDNENNPLLLLLPGDEEASEPVVTLKVPAASEN